MPTISRCSQVNYSAGQMFDLVNDIDSYKAFVPWCVDSQVVEKLDDTTLKACLSFSSHGFEKSFTTANALTPHKTIAMSLVDGPFSELEGTWSFESLDGGASKVSLVLSFEFSNRLLASLFGPVFNQVIGALVDSFSERAKVVYGQPAAHAD